MRQMVAREFGLARTDPRPPKSGLEDVAFSQVISHVTIDSNGLMQRTLPALQGPSPMTAIPLAGFGALGPAVVLLHACAKSRLARGPRRVQWWKLDSPHRGESRRTFAGRGPEFTLGSGCGGRGQETPLVDGTGNKMQGDPRARLLQLEYLTTHGTAADKLVGLPHMPGVDLINDCRLNVDQSRLEFCSHS
ncbi:hypothetical protein CSUB01_06715 [Colletotrichum sublineola]|uniref:Uncharacterized protein n=1 Tax=Colletotrichum sublineola TaxID=1173701 RepID=A0A066XSF2_COLSU|nr:hypothetical protein CSUB01_06715 [Colletotrichum sublineola]